MTHTVDLTDCDREPIHIPGAVQPHGVLLACRRDDLIIEQVSENVSTMLGLAVESVLGSSLLTWITPASAKAVESAALLERPREVCPVRVETTEGRLFDAAIHVVDDTVLVVELEAASTQPHAFHPQLRRAVARLSGGQTPLELCRIAVDEVRALTGFDRVMAYRFDPEWNGEVIAEARRDDLGTFLGHHYPASDIPVQARRLYTVNWLRFIADANYTPSPIVPTLHPRTKQPLDMSFSVVRSVSPIHCEYLRNMGVHASMSVSLLCDGQLWGLIACHHYEGPKIVPYVVRDSCEFLAQSLSWHISTNVHAEAAAKSLATVQVEGRLLDAMASAPDFLDALASDTLLEIAGATGAAVIFEGNVRCVGETPSERTVRELATWAGLHMTEGAFVTDRLHTLRTTDSEVDDRASGLLAVAISKAHGDYVLWFRASTERVIDWAGHPHKNVSVTDGVERLSPRGSFELWRETVRGRSLPWEPWQVAGASNLRRAILGGVRSRAETLRKLNDQLVAADHAKDVFVATVSHELRTPLNAITGWVELLRQGRLDDARKSHALDVIQRNARAQTELVDDLIDISRLASGKLTLSIETLNAASVVESALESIALAAEAKSIRVKTLIDSAGTTMLGDERRLQQVVWNLLTNAIKFTPKGGRIDVLLHRHGSDVELIVSDSGEGIAAEFLPHVFELFRQADDRTTRERKGLGLGLSISRHIVEAHGGRITVESEGSGKGTTFRVRLPVSPLLIRAESSPADEIPALSQELAGRRIAIVEDEADSRDLLMALLSSSGALVEAFGNAEEALQRLPAWRPDLIISDIGLPGMDGYAFVARLRELDPDAGGTTPVIALTAHTRSKDRTQALRAGFSSHVPKPVDPSELLAVIRSQLGRPSPVP